MGFLVGPFLLHLPWVGGFPVRTHMPQMDAFASLKRFLSSFSFIVNITLAIGRMSPGEGWKGEFLLSAFRTVILWAYLFTFPTSPCMNLALLPSHLSHSQNNKRLIYWLPFDEFLMPRMCVLTGVSPCGSSGSGILRGTAGPLMATNLSVTPVVMQSQQPLVGLRQGLISSECNGIQHL